MGNRIVRMQFLGEFIDFLRTRHGASVFGMAFKTCPESVPIIFFDSQMRFFVFTFNLLASGQLETVLVKVVDELRRSMRTICFTAQIQNLPSA